MQFPTKARLAVAAVAASAVSMGVAAPSFASTNSTSGTNTTNTTSTILTSKVSAKAVVGKPLEVQVTIAATSSVPAAAITYTIDYGDGSGVSAAAPIPAGGQLAAHPYAAAGAYTIKVVFSDGKSTVTKTTTFGAGNGTLPTAVATVTAVPNTLNVNLDVSKSLPATTPAGQAIKEIHVDWGEMINGVPGKTQIVPITATNPITALIPHTYTASGTYTVKVSVWDTNLATQNVTPSPVVTVSNGTPPPGGGGNPPGTGPSVQRLGGVSRYDTGVVVSKQAFPAAGSVHDVIVATGAKFPDALSGVPLAKKLGAPLLLVDPTDPTGVGASNLEVKAEIARVLAAGGTVHVLGGESAVPTTLANALNPAGAAAVDRIAGATRFDTSVAIAHKLGDPKNVVVARGDDGVNLTGFADALSAGPYAANVFGGGNGAVLLSNNTTLDPAVKAYLAGATSIQAVGGPAATAVGTGANVQAPIKGADRWDTAAQVAAKFTTPATAGVAYGFKFPDALTGAAFLAVKNGPLVLTDTNSVPVPTTSGALQGLGHALGTTGTIWVFGGQAVITETARGQIATNSGGHLV